jgi:hypothetical protein
MDAHEATKYGTAEDLSMYLIDIDPEELDDLPPTETSIPYPSYSTMV